MCEWYLVKQIVCNRICARRLVTTSTTITTTTAIIITITITATYVI